MTDRELLEHIARQNADQGTKLDRLIDDYRLIHHEVLRLRDRVAALESVPPSPPMNGEAAE